MSKLPIQSSIIQNNDESANNLLTSLTYVQQDQYIEKQAVNNLTNDDKYDASLKNFSSIKYILQLLVHVWNEHAIN